MTLAQNNVRVWIWCCNDCNQFGKVEAPTYIRTETWKGLIQDEHHHKSAECLTPFEGLNLVGGKSSREHVQRTLPKWASRINPILRELEQQQ